MVSDPIVNVGSVRRSVEVLQWSRSIFKILMISSRTRGVVPVIRLLMHRLIDFYSISKMKCDDLTRPAACCFFSFYEHVNVKYDKEPAIWFFRNNCLPRAFWAHFALWSHTRETGGREGNWKNRAARFRPCAFWPDLPLRVLLLPSLLAFSPSSPSSFPYSLSPFSPFWKGKRSYRYGTRGGRVSRSDSFGNNRLLG